MAVDLAHIQCFCQVFVPQSVPAKPSKMDGPSSKLADSFKALQEVATAYIKCPSMSFIYLYNYTMWQTAWKLHCRPSIRDLVTANIASIFVWRHLCMQPGTYMRQIGRTYNWARQSGCVCFNFPISLSLSASAHLLLHLPLFLSRYCRFLTPPCLQKHFFCIPSHSKCCHPWSLNVIGFALVESCRFLCFVWGAGFCSRGIFTAVTTWDRCAAG